jgi:hypothetical protein
VAQTGMKAAGIDLQKYLLDTVTFDPAKPDLKSSWKFPFSLDTIFRHSSPGASVYKDTVSLVTGISTGSVSSISRSISMNSGLFAIAYSVREPGNAEIGIYSMSGKAVADKRLAIEKTGSIAWKELGGLPAGIYFMQLKVNGFAIGKNTFFKF